MTMDASRTPSVSAAVAPRAPASPGPSRSPDLVLELIGVERTFDTTPPVRALKNVDLSVYPGDYLAIVGPSGSGKSTLLNVLGLLDRPTAGVYFLDGCETTTATVTELAALRASRLGFVFQSFHLLDRRTTLENAMFGGLYRGVPRKERRRRAVEALERVGLGHRIDFYPDKLSGGERQRVAVARALAAEPTILLCDEPTGNLDTATSGSVLDLFDELVEAGITMCVITHDPDVAARAHRCVTLVDGVLTEGNPTPGQSYGTYGVGPSGVTEVAGSVGVPPASSGPPAGVER